MKSAAAQYIYVLNIINFMDFIYFIDVFLLMHVNK